MEPKEVVRYLTLPIETRKEILKIVYSRGKDKGKKIETWINIEMLAKLLELKEKNEVEEVEGEHKYHVPKTTYPRVRYPRCDLWWAKKSSEHWLEVKTFRFHNNAGLHQYKKRIKDNLKKEKYLRPPYNFHHLLIVFDDKHYDNGNWLEDLYSLYNSYNLKKEDEWKIELDERRTLHLFLHYKSEDNQ